MIVGDRWDVECGCCRWVEGDRKKIERQTEKRGIYLDWAELS